MRDQHGVDVDPQLLLPEDLRKNWVVIDRFGGYHLFIAGMLFGAGVVLTAAGYFVGSEVMKSAFPVALFCMYLFRTIRMRSERRLLSELQGRI